MGKNKKLTNDETAYFCEQLSLVISAGIPLAEGAEMIAESTGSRGFRRVAEQIVASLSEEHTLFEAMQETQAFPEYAVNMVKIGTLSGRLDDVLRGLSDYYEERSAQVRNIRSAALHPLILIAMMSAVIIVLIVQVIPMFSDIFGQFDPKISATVTESVNYAYSTGTIVLIVLLAILAAAGIIALLSVIPAFRRALAGFASKFFLTKNISHIFARAKFTNAMSMMVASGIESSEALENSMLLISDKRMLSSIKKARDSVVEGEPFADAVNDNKILPPIYSRSLKMAYKSGAFDSAWKKISERCSDEATVTTENLIAFIEPLLIAFMAVVIGAILLAVMIPMMDIISALG